MDELIERAIKSAAEGIVFFLRDGWAEEAAIAQIRQGSTLGPKSWARVLEIVKVVQDAGLTK